MGEVLLRDEVQRLFQQALAASKADETEILLGGGRLHVVRLDAGRIAENRSESWCDVRIRAHVQGKVGIAHAGSADSSDVLMAVRDAEAAARDSPPWPGLEPLPGPAPYKESAEYDPAVADMSPAARLAYVAPLILDARRHKARASGVFAARAGSLGVGGEPGLMAIANSHGLFVFHRTTRLRLDARIEAGDGSGWGEAEHWLARSFDPAPAVARALQKALAGRKRHPLAPGTYDAIFEPAAMASVLRSIAPHFSARARYEGWSFLAGLRSVAKDNITVRDDFNHPLHRGLPFDGEGVPRTAVTFIEKGLVKGMVYSRSMARLYGVAPTGHMPIGPSRGEAFPEHLVMEGQDRSIEDLIASTERGLLVSRLAFHRVLDPTRAVCAGTTCDGTYLIEKGRVRHAVGDLRYEMGVFDMLNLATQLSRPERALGVVAPAVKSKLRVLGTSG
jgi:predicted Zn-dependent protease